MFVFQAIENTSITHTLWHPDDDDVSLNKILINNQLNLDEEMRALQPYTQFSLRAPTSQFCN